MKPSSSIALRPICSFIFLALIVLLIPILVILTWSVMTKQFENAAKFVSNYVHNDALLDVENAARFLLPINSSALQFARVLSSSLNATQLSFSTIETKVAPPMFLLFSTLLLSQISYIGSDGLFFSYYIEGNQTFAAYSNTSFVKTTPNASIVYICYNQPVDQFTGKRYGKVSNLDPLVSIDSSWYQQALNSSNGYASLGKGWGKTQEHLFLGTAAIDGKGVISLGFPVKIFTVAISRIDLHLGDLYLATKDGTSLIQSGPLSIVPNNNMVSIQFHKSTGDLASTQVVNISCEPSENLLRTTNMSIVGEKYFFYCAPLEIAGVQSVSLLAFSHKGLVSLVHKNSKLALVLLFVMLSSVVVSISFFTFLIFRTARKEMFLRAALIKQMEETQQAERKTMSKSLAFAGASHDVRSSLAALDGLIVLSIAEVAPKSELYMHLKQMKDLASDLVGMLNCVLDTSKIEAGKMQLVEEEFDLVQVIEDAVNLFYPIGISKGVDVVLDPCDGSVLKHSLVKGDRGRLKQILNNLIHNAVKFTEEGHVSVRAWAKKRSLESSILASENVGMWNCLSWFSSKNDHLSVLHEIQQKTFMEFVIEVDDTGKGIPKEKHKSVFENFVQVKDTALQQEGSGLGLGIVQSLVRLMGGEIKIVDKEFGDRGTCFRFNILFSTGETSIATAAEGEDNKLIGELTPNELQQQYFGQNIRNQNPRSHVVLLIQGDGRRQILQKFIQSLGLKVSTLSQLEFLFPTLEKIKHKLDLGYLNYLGKSDFSSLSDCLSNSASCDLNMELKDGSLSDDDEMDRILPLHRKTSFKSSSSFILVIIDFNAGQFSKDRFLDVCSRLTHFRRDLHDSQCKVVWLYTPNANFELRRREERMLAQCENIIPKPFHGFRLYQVLRMLPEFGGTTAIQGYIPKPSEKIVQPSIGAGPSTEPTPIMSNSGTLKSPQYPEPQQVLHINSDRSSDEPLSGKKILVAEDSSILVRIAKLIVSKAGATFESCENGEEAVEKVRRALQETVHSIQGDSKVLPYDYILMDCEMPTMNGYEAAKQIRMVEKIYGVHIPIIALTAYSQSDDHVAKTMVAGMDFHLTKPLTTENLLKAIRFIDGCENV